MFSRDRSGQALAALVDRFDLEGQRPAGVGELGTIHRSGSRIEE
jgi:hypothetical protein